ncbi:MAG: aldehyde dehydrogenase family protein [Pseudomonadota bacterium]
MLGTSTIPGVADAAVARASVEPSLADEAANAAAAAFGDWSGRPAEARVALLGEVAEALGAARDRLVALAAREVGAAPAWIDFNIAIAQAMLKETATLPPLLAERRITHAGRGTTSLLRRQPVGVVLSFAPWNAPVTLAVRALAAPLACGNTVVLVASDHCPETQRAVVEVFREAGLPAGAATVVTNRPAESEAVSRALIAHPAVRRITFTGSTRVGRHIAAMAAPELKRCLLELSGKAPLIVLPDADLDAAVEAAAFGAFFNQGQICIATERIILVGDAADAFVPRLVARAATLRAADPAEEAAPLGRLINAAAGARLSALIEDARAKGAELLIGGEVAGPVMQPAVLDRVDATMRIYHEEAFGPVAAILRVADVEEAISIANDSELGLAAAVFSRDADAAMAVADRLETGICQINGPTVYDDPAMPFGGMKASGYGRFGGPAAIEEFTELRWIAQHQAGAATRHSTLMS